MDKHIEANAELAADLLRHMADNEIDSDYFAVVTDSPNCGMEIQSEHKVTDTALMVAGIIDALLAKLEAAEKERDEFKRYYKTACADWEETQQNYDSSKRVVADLRTKLEAAEARLLVPVKLPDGYIVRAGHPINEGERNVLMPKEGGNWLSRFDVEHAIRVAGFKIEGNANAE